MMLDEVYQEIAQAIAQEKQEQELSTDEAIEALKKMGEDGLKKK